MLYVFICELDIHLNDFRDMSTYHFISILLDTLYMQSRHFMRALVVQSVPSAHRGCAVNHRCITLNENILFFLNENIKIQYSYDTYIRVYSQRKIFNLQLCYLKKILIYEYSIGIHFYKNRIKIHKKLFEHHNI